MTSAQHCSSHQTPHSGFPELSFYCLWSTKRIYLWFSCSELKGIFLKPEVPEEVKKPQKAFRGEEASLTDFQAALSTLALKQAGVFSSYTPRGLASTGMGHVPVKLQRQQHEHLQELLLSPELRSRTPAPSLAQPGKQQTLLSWKRYSWSKSWEHFIPG